MVAITSATDVLAMSIGRPAASDMICLQHSGPPVT
jgi:hypothetical protein